MEIDKNTISNFNMISDEVLQVRMKKLINALSANQGLYCTESAGIAARAATDAIRKLAQQTLQKESGKGTYPDPETDDLETVQ